MTTTTTYTAGWNLPGYLPDTVEEFDSWETAVDFMEDEMLREWADGDPDVDGLRELRCNSKEPAFIHYSDEDGYCYWIEPAA